MSKLCPAPGLALPVEAVTETFGILAVRGAGKSNAAVVMAEEMFKAKLPFVAIDPARAWWGLRSSADGKGPGLPVPIFGGRHGDVPLERTGGPLVADLISDERLSCVLDISEFESEGARKQFLLDFARRLFQRAELPLHLFLEEAHHYLPQKPMRDEAQLLRAWENIVTGGRNRGLGCTLITQRSALLNKNVLTQIGTLIALRTTSPQDRAAIEAWVKYHDQSLEIVQSLPSLEDGEAWVWSPEFLKKTVRIRFRRRETFDSGATPKVTAATRPPATLADVDLAGIQRRMAATIEKAKAEDPRELRRRIGELEEKLRASRNAPTSAPTAVPKRIEVPVLKDAQIKRLETIATRIDRAMTQLGEWAAAFTGTEREIRKVGAEIATAIRAPRAAANPPSGPASIGIPGRIRAPQTSPRAIQGPGEVAIGAGERKMLEALALRHPEPLSKAQLGLLAGYAASGGTFRTYLPRLHRAGLVDVHGDQVALTSEGRAAVGDIRHAPQTPEHFRSMWLGALDQGPRRMLEVLIGAYPKALTKQELGEASGYEAAGGTFRTYLPKLKRLGLVEVDRDQVRASETLFL